MRRGLSAIYFLQIVMGAMAAAACLYGVEDDLAARGLAAGLLFVLRACSWCTEYLRAEILLIF